MNPRDVKFLNNGLPLVFDVITGFAVNPDGGTAYFSADHVTQVLTVVGTGTVIVYGSAQEYPPDFTAPSTITNSYAPLVLADYSLPNTYYAGTAGVTVAGATALVEANVNLITWFAISRSLNSVDVKATETNNA